MAHAEVLLAYLADPTVRVLKSYERLREIYPDNTRRCRLVARGMALTSEHPLPWWQCADMLAAEQKVSK